MSKTKDTGGWRSVGRQSVCTKCGNTDATMIETVIYGKHSLTQFCNVCARQFEEPLDDDDDRAA